MANAQEKVLADANQMGLTLNAQELHSIASIYAANTYVKTGSFGTASGTAPEWLDQAITDTLLNIQGQRVGKLPTDFSTLPTGQSHFSQLTQGYTDPSNLFGISSELYNQFQNIAQQYLMYNPTDSTGSLLKQSDILKSVGDALQNYTGSGSSFGSTNLINGAVQQYTQQMISQASQMYPGLAASIKAGTSPASFVQPYSSVISSMTGINPQSINYTDPKWNWVISTPDPKTNVKTALTLDQLQQKLATTPMFNQSNNAQQMAEGVTQNLNRSFGFGGN